MASALGIGLLAIKKNRIDQVLSAPLQNPLPEVRLKLLENLRCGVCSLCGTVFRIGDSGKKDFSKVSRDSDTKGVMNAAEQGRGYMYWLYKTSVKRDRKAEN